MNPEKNQEVGTKPEGGEAVVRADDVISISKTEYEKLNQTVGSLKRELKDYKKSKDDAPELEPLQKNQAESNNLLEKAYLRTAGITDPVEVEDAIKTAKKWNMLIDQLVDDDDYKVRLEKIRAKKSNEIATTNIKGDKGATQTKNDPSYWIALGKPPTSADVPDRKTRATIARAFMNNAKNGKKFYND